MNEQNKKVNNYVNELNKKYCWSNDRNLDRFYSLNRKNYQRTKQIYKDVEPTFMLQFAIILPTDIPFDKNEFSTYKQSEDGNKIGFSYHFDNLKEKSFFYIGKPSKFRKAFDTYRTRCEISVLMKSAVIKIDDIVYNIEKDMQFVKYAKHKKEYDLSAFIDTTKRVFSAQKFLQDIAINDLNEVLLNYAFLSGDDTICSINRDNIEFASHFRGVSLVNWETFNWMTVHNVQAYPRERNSSFNADFLAQSMIIRPTENYFYAFKQHLQDSKYIMAKGQTIGSLIEMNTAIEVLLTQILVLYWSAEEKLGINEIEAKLEDISFMRRIKVEMQKVLGGNWDITKSGKPLHEWYENSYLLRNKIVHGGYMPEMNEVFKSMNASYDFINYVIDLMNKSKYEFLHGLNAAYKIDIKTMKL